MGLFYNIMFLIEFKMKYIFSLIWCVFSIYTLGQFKVIDVAAVPSGGFAPCEPSIAINPNNVAEMVVGTVLNGVHHSNDSGKTWKSATLLSPYGVWGDPVLIADSQGRFYYFHLSDPDNDTGYQVGRKLDRIVCQTSDDGGNTWTQGSYVGINENKKQDKPWAMVDYRGYIHLTWTEFDKYGSNNTEDKSRIKHSKSTERGVSWSEPLTISNLEGTAIDNSSTAEGVVPAAGVGSQVYAVWSRNDSLWLNKSHDGGENWPSKESFVHEHIGGWSFTLPSKKRANGMPILLCDAGNSPFKGMLYLNWLSYDSISATGINYFSSSTDGGRTWSAPTMIGQEVGASATLKFFTWTTLDPVTGYLYTVYYDQKNNPEHTFDAYISYSKDAGLTWVEMKLTDKPFELKNGYFFGDYNHIAAYNGIIRPVWTMQIGNKQKVCTAIITQDILDQWVY